MKIKNMLPPEVTKDLTKNSKSLEIEKAIIERENIEDEYTDSQSDFDFEKGM